MSDYDNIINTPAELICPVCNESYVRIHHYSNHMAKKHNGTIIQDAPPKANTYIKSVHLPIQWKYEIHDLIEKGLTLNMSEFIRMAIQDSLKEYRKQLRYPIISTERSFNIAKFEDVDI